MHVSSCSDLYIKTAYYDLFELYLLGQVLNRTVGQFLNCTVGQFWNCTMKQALIRAVGSRHDCMIIKTSSKIYIMTCYELSIKTGSELLFREVMGCTSGKVLNCTF